MKQITENIVEYTEEEALLVDVYNAVLDMGNSPLMAAAKVEVMTGKLFNRELLMHLLY